MAPKMAVPKAKADNLLDRLLARRSDDLLEKDAVTLKHGQAAKGRSRRCVVGWFPLNVSRGRLRLVSVGWRGVDAREWVGWCAVDPRRLLVLRNYAIAMGPVGASLTCGRGPGAGHDRLA